MTRTFLLLTLFFLGCQSAPPPAPVMGWSQIADDTFVLNAGAALTGYYVPKGVPIGSFSLTIQTTAPVMLAYVPEQYRETVMDPASLSAAPNVAMFFCTQGNVLHTTLRCALDTSEHGYFLWMRDQRTSSGAVDSGIAAIFGVKGPAEQHSIRNDVHVTYSIYTCLANCPGKSGLEYPRK